MKPDDPDFNDMVQVLMDEGHSRTVAVNAVLLGEDPPHPDRLLLSGIPPRFTKKSPYDERGDAILGPPDTFVDDYVAQQQAEAAVAA